MEGTIVMCSLVVGIAIVGSIYFTIQDRRAVREDKELEYEENEEVYSEWLHSIRRV